ncbi:MAG: quinone-dependent dihydroorotate dehydrogenase [Bacteroidia bacterium]|nr:quinone-dependent dihydroorotate dehydrogenase [Bacteroidia bacterium]
MYQRILRPFLFKLDAESAHHATFWALRILLAIPGVSWIFGRILSLDDRGLERELLGMHFRNPVGLAAGFDKDALLAHRWKALGFGFVEVGTVTPRPQAGNPKPRLFRLPEDQAIINRMGFNNQGVEAMVSRLKHINRKGIILGANIGKNKDTPNEQAVEDYLICFEALFPYVDYFVVNVSSPNTPGLRSLQEKGPLTEILNTLQEANQAQAVPKPILLKIAPDLTPDQLDDIVEVANTTQLSGLIATNTTISRENLHASRDKVAAIGAGGLSGLPLTHQAWEVMHYLRQKLGPDFVIIGVGGIMETLDARMRLDQGADLIQLYTGYVYQGPMFVKRILRSMLWATHHPDNIKRYS